MPNNRELLVSDADVGKRLDVFLAEQIPELSRSAAQKLVESGMVTVGGALPQKKEKLRLSDVVSVILPEAEDERPKPEEIPLDILYEDADLLIVNKPKGMVVHPAAGNKSGTLVNGLLYRYGDQLSDINGEIRPGILHRIDKNTSGLLMVAKNNDAHLFLAEQIQAHSFTREYRAILHGVVKEDCGSWSYPIGRHHTERKRMAVNGENPREAITHYEVLERFGRFSYVKFRLETGRTHQIRVHASYAGYPVAGDDVYGPRKCITELNGQCLHAIKLGFIHPSTREYMEFSCDLPDYFEKFLRKAEKL